MTTEKDRKAFEKWWVFLPISSGIGTAAGALLGNAGVGLSFGAAVGTTLNLAFYYHHKRSIRGSGK